MGDVFLNLLNISITAGWLILAVILLRLLLKKAPKSVNFILWALVALRLVFPFSIESALSLVPSAQPVQQEAYSAGISVDSGISAVDTPVNSLIDSGYNAVQTEKSIDIAEICGIVWVAGLAVMAVYFTMSYLRVKKQTEAKIILRDNIFICDDITSPFILGVFRPKIILPSGMSDEQTGYVIRHEAAHIRHHDNLWKPLGYLLLSVYWFNPLTWAAYILLCRDIELACDERVIKNMDKNSVAGYSQALLDCVSNKRTVLTCPVAFGETATKERVKKVLNYKKPSFWIIIIAVIACIAAAVCFMTNPAKSKSELIDSETHSGQIILSYFGLEDGIDDIFNDFRSIDFYHEPDFSNKKYTVKEEADAESSTKQIKYYDGDKLVYIDYEGYGEDTFDYFTETKGGTPVKASYVDEGGRYSVNISDGTYAAHFSNLDKKSPLGAKDVYFGVIKENEKDAAESLSLEFKGESYYIGSAQYYKGNDFVRYSAYFENESDKVPLDDEYVLFSKQTGKVDSDMIKAICESKDKIGVETVFGNHKFSYKEAASGKEWYITADLYVIFDSKEKAEEFAENKALKNAEASSDMNGDKEIWYARIQGVTFPVADSAEYSGAEIIRTITEQIDDPEYRELIFHNNTLAGIEADHLLTRN